MGNFSERHQLKRCSSRLARSPSLRLWTYGDWARVGYDLADPIVRAQHIVLIVVCR